MRVKRVNPLIVERYVALAAVLSLCVALVALHGRLSRAEELLERVSAAQDYSKDRGAYRAATHPVAIWGGALEARQ